MDIKFIYDFLKNNAENIENLAIYLPFIWALLFTKDWLYISSFYKFYGINRLCKTDLKDLLNLRYVASLFISILLYVVFSLIVLIKPVFLIIGGAVLLIIPVAYLICECVLSKEVESQEDMKTPEINRLNYKYKLYAARFAFNSGVIVVMLVIYSLAAYNVFPILNDKGIIYVAFNLFPLVVISLLVDSELKRISASASQPVFWFYLTQPLSVFVGYPKSYFYRLHKFITLVEYKDSTYILIFPLDNEEREFSIAIRTVLCRNSKDLIHAYISPNEIIYDLDLSECQQKSYFVDKITRVSVDSTVIAKDSSLNDLCNAEQLMKMFIADEMEEYLAKDSWKEIKETQSKKVVNKRKKL